MPLNLTADEFYRLRGDRTNRVTDSRDYHTLFVRIAAGPATAQSYAGQVQLLLASNMLARWCRRFELGFPEAQLHPRLRLPGLSTLHARIEKELREADPFASFEFRQSRSADVAYALGVGEELSEPVDSRIHSNGWSVWAGREIDTPRAVAETVNPTGPAFAACLGMADAFKVATRLPADSRIQGVALSLFSLAPIVRRASQPPQPSPSLKLGRTQMVGLGSVGSAVVYLLRMVDLDGRFQLTLQR
jgi:hypothetical protein